MSYHLLKCLRHHENIEVSAITLNEGRLSKEIRGLGIHVDVVDETKRNFFQIVGDIKKILSRRSIDTVHSHRYKENILAFLASRCGDGIRLVGTQHGMPEILGTNRNWKYTLLHRFNIFLLLKSFSKVIAVSTDIQRIFMKCFGFPIEKIAVIHNGTDIPDEPPSRKGKDFFVIGSMGRIFPVKDYLLMVEIASQVSAVTDKIRFELAGDGPDRANIEEAVEKYRLEHIFRLRGTVEDLPCFYRRIDLYLNTSLHEGIPMTVLEAMSYGIPVVAPNVGGLKEMLEDGKEGYLVDGRDPAEFARKCLHLHENSALRESMGTLARKRVEKEFSAESMTREYYLMYQDLARDTASGGHA